MLPGDPRILLDSFDPTPVADYRQNGSLQRRLSASEIPRPDVMEKRIAKGDLPVDPAHQRISDVAAERYHSSSSYAMIAAGMTVI
jgi:hypothetical protein